MILSETNSLTHRVTRFSNMDLNMHVENSCILYIEEIVNLFQDCIYLHFLFLWKAGHIEYILCSINSFSFSLNVCISILWWTF
jgi:hypothetical protein